MADSSKRYGIAVIVALGLVFAPVLATLLLIHLPAVRKGDPVTILFLAALPVAFYFNVRYFWITRKARPGCRVSDFWTSWGVGRVWKAPHLYFEEPEVRAYKKLRWQMLIFFILLAASVLALTVSRGWTP